MRSRTHSSARQSSPIIFIIPLTVINVRRTVPISSSSTQLLEPLRVKLSSLATTMTEKWKRYDNLDFCLNCDFFSDLTPKSPIESYDSAGSLVFNVTDMYILILRLPSLCSDEFGYCVTEKGYESMIILWTETSCTSKRRKSLNPKVTKCNRASVPGIAFSWP